jgi:hypothetical protein
MRFTIASRCLLHKASQSFIDVGRDPGAVVVVDPLAAAEVVDPPAVVDEEALVASLLPLLPQAAAMSDRPNRPAPRQVIRDLFTFPPSGLHRTWITRERGFPRAGRGSIEAIRRRLSSVDLRQVNAGGGEVTFEGLTP